MKVVEYWHETIKNHRYDRDVSMTTLSHVMIGHGLVDLDRVTFRQPEGCRLKWEFPSNLINLNHYHEHSLLSLQVYIVDQWLAL